MQWSELLPYLATAVAGACVYAGIQRWRLRRPAPGDDALWHTLFDSYPAPSYAYDLDTLRLVAVNETLCERYGYQASELLHQPVTLLHVASELDDLHRVIRGLRDSHDTQFRYRWTHRKRSGELVPVEIMSRPLRRGGADIRVVTATDISEKLHAEQALRESESRLAQILHNSPTPTFVIDAQHRITVWNPACEYTFGIPAADMLGTTRQWTVFYDVERPCMADVVLDGGGLTEIERLYHGRYRVSPLNPLAFDAVDYFPKLGRWLLFTAAPLRDSKGAVVGAIESIIDLSEQKRAQEQVERLNSDLEHKVLQRTNELAQANEHLRQAMQQLVQSEKLAALGSVVAGVSHELNTPLGIVLTAATSLQHQARQLQGELSNPAGLRRTTLMQFIGDSIEATGLMERNIERAAALVRNFKDVAMDPSSSQRRSFSLRSVVDDAVRGLHDALAQGHHQVTVDVAATLVLDGYPGALHEILTKLLENSALHGFEGRPGGTVAIAAHADTDTLHLFYQDDGLGMEATAVNRAFEPFYTTKLGQGGSGLGLYTVYNLATGLLGGCVQLDSTPGTGARFHFTLPLCAPEHEEHTLSIDGFL